MNLNVIPGRGQWWSHGRILSRDQSSGVSQCEWTCEPLSPGPVQGDGGRERD